LFHHLPFYYHIAQRFALLAGGRAWILFESRKNSKPEKCLKMPQNPQRPVHALLGCLPAYQNLLLEMHHTVKDLPAFLQP
jgi:hypothetical protein